MHFGLSPQAQHMALVFASSRLGTGMPRMSLRSDAGKGINALKPLLAALES